MDISPGRRKPFWKPSAALRPYLAVAAVFAALAAVVGLGWTGWAPTTWLDWAAVLGLTPAGVGGVLIGDRVGLWLKDRGFGRQ
ncbi:hypothetical protein [Pseudonocardia lacus]|uniref:hypothetical protein n=1 Tax=Pseudonocardia lacus TaxID=2835865 RepID=UPI001BDD11D4|nr:hypothetical protein [Pseudonocardia lacus]